MVDIFETQLKAYLLLIVYCTSLACPRRGLPSAWPALSSACPRLGLACPQGGPRPWRGLPLAWSSLGVACTWCGKPSVWHALCLAWFRHGLPMRWPILAWPALRVACPWDCLHHWAWPTLIMPTSKLWTRNIVHETHMVIVKTMSCWKNGCFI